MACFVSSFSRFGTSVETCLCACLPIKFASSRSSSPRSRSARRYARPSILSSCPFSVTQRISDMRSRKKRNTTRTARWMSMLVAFRPGTRPHDTVGGPWPPTQRTTRRLIISASDGSSTGIFSAPPSGVVFSSAAAPDRRFLLQDGSKARASDGGGGVVLSSTDGSGSPISITSCRTGTRSTASHTPVSESSVLLAIEWCSDSAMITSLDPSMAVKSPPPPPPLASALPPVGRSS